MKNTTNLLRGSQKTRILDRKCRATKNAAGSYKNLLRQNIFIHLNDSSDSKKDVF